MGILFMRLKLKPKKCCSKIVCRHACFMKYKNEGKRLLKQPFLSQSDAKCLCAFASTRPKYLYISAACNLNLNGDRDNV